MHSLYCLALLPAISFSLSTENAQIARSRLFEALRSPSGKLTLSAEINIPEPTDPTAILLQSTGITTLSESFRVQAKANAAWISGSVTSLKTFCVEQEQARGNFPGPVPVIYCDDTQNLDSVVEAGADGLLVSTGGEIGSLDDLATSGGDWVDTCKAALECGLAPIPEVTIRDEIADSWKEDDMEALVSKITELSGGEPAGILLTVNPKPLEEDEEEPAPVSLPTIAKSLGKKTPIVGSIAVAAGGGRMGQEIARFKASGFTGALLRSKCVPPALNQDLEFVGGFWSACIGDLKSLKSKSFNFQSRNWMDKSASLEWAKYQQRVIEDGALGDPASAVPMGLNSEKGDYVGF